MPLNEELRSIFERIFIELTVWKKSKTGYVCEYSNNLNISEGIELKDYLKKCDKGYGAMYDKLEKTKKDQIYVSNREKCYLSIIDGKYILEYKMPSSNYYHNILSIISYKLRIPLTDIIGAITLIDGKKVDGKVAAYINTIKKSCHDIILVANDIIDVLNFEQDRIDLKLEKIDLKNFLLQCKKISAADIGKKDVKLRLSISTSVPPIILSDSMRLKQIILNLLSNAIKNTPIGGISLSVYLDPKYPHNLSQYSIIFKVKDTGNGIGEKTKKVINDIFTENKSEYMPHLFSGFGLIISKYICEKMGGKIWFDSEKNMGSAFYFSIVCKGLKF